MVPLYLTVVLRQFGFFLNFQIDDTQISVSPTAFPPHSAWARMQVLVSRWMKREAGAQRGVEKWELLCAIYLELLDTSPLTLTTTKQKD